MAETIIFILRLATAVVLVPFIAIQWKLRKRNGIIKRLRRHLLWETVALLTLFLQIAFFRQLFIAANFDAPTWVEFASIVPTLGVFITFLSGTRLFLDIDRGKYDIDGHKVDEAGH